MSRIEKAMEKAARVRRGMDVQETQYSDRDVRPATIHRPPPLETVAERIVSDSPYLVNLNAPSSPIGEEFRKLKSSLIKLTNNEVFKNTLLVTSSVPGEGKTISALNLAISLAQEYDHTVLLVDADLRRPSIQRYLEVDERRGFSDCLMGEAEIGDVIIPTGIGRLSVITAGRAVPNPDELFASQKTRDMILEMKHRYCDRYIIFDSPPVLPFAEPRTLSHLLDGVLFVVKERLASVKNVKDALYALKGAELLGLIYNDALIDLKDEQYSSYKSYQSYSR